MDEGSAPGGASAAEGTTLTCATDAHGRAGTATTTAATSGSGLVAPRQQWQLGQPGGHSSPQSSSHCSAWAELSPRRASSTSSPACTSPETSTLKRSTHTRSNIANASSTARPAPCGRAGGVVGGAQ